MNTNQTFHTPSFGDEEFEIPAVPVEQVYKINDQQTQSTHGTNDSNMIMCADYTMCEVSDDSGSHLIDEKKKKIRDPSEPSKPISAYALFFKDTQAAIKGQNPDASFKQVSKIVASMWEALDPEHKSVYKKKAEAARREYCKALAAFRANVMSMGDDVNVLGVQDSASVNKNTALNAANIIKSSGTQNSISACQVAPVVNQQIDEHQRNVHIAEDSSMQGQQHTRESDADESISLIPKVIMHRCIRDGCTNIAIINPDWEDEYCSNECVVTHCRNVFSQWVQANALSPEQFASS